MFSRLNLIEKGLILVMVPVLIQVVFVATLAAMLSSAAQDFERFDRDSDRLNGLRRNELEMVRAFVLANDAGADKVARLAQVKAQMARLVAQNPQEIQSEKSYPDLNLVVEEISSLRFQVLLILRGLSQALEHQMGAHPDYAVPAQWEEAAFLQARTTSRELSAVESKLFVGASEQLQQTRWTVCAALIGVLLLSAAISAGLFYTFLFDTKRRLSIIAKNAERLAIGEQLEAPPRWARDEIAELDIALHQASRILDDIRHKELTILENAADVICSLDSKLRFRAAGAVVEKLWRYASADLLGMSLLTLLATDDLDATRQAFQRVREQGEGEIESPIVCKDGKIKNLLWKVSWSDKEDSFFCVVHDVTELRAIEKLKRHFIAIVSHDLRTPLTSVGVCLAFLLAGRRGKIPDEVRKLLDMAEKSATRLMDLVNELLELEKLNSGKFTLSPMCVSISDVSAAAKEQLQLTADQAKVSLRGPIGDALAFADQTRLIQVVTNLLANAISYSPEDSTVRLSIVKSNSEFVQLRVSDQGPVIPLEERSSIFDKFQRPGAPYSVSVRRTGLGLAVVKAIVEAHGGQVGIDSNSGKGNVFWITLPRYRDEEEDDL